MDIDASQGWHSQYRRGEDLTKGGHHDHIVFQLLQLGDEMGILYPLRLQDLKAEIEGEPLCRRGCDLLSPAAGAIGLGNDRDYLFSISQRSQRGEGKGCRPHEDGPQLPCAGIHWL